MRSLLRHLIVILCACSLSGSLACSDTKPKVSAPKITKKQPGGPGTKKTQREMTEDEAMAFLTEQCAGCHAPGAPMAITWEMPEAKDLSATAIMKMDTNGVMYQTMVNRYNDTPAGQQPTPMPPSIPDEKRAELGLFLEWMRINLPSAVAGAEAVYGGAAQFGSTIAINLTYECSQVTKGRDFVFRFFNRAFGRPPRIEELDQYLPATERDQPITDERRAQIAALIQDAALKQEFYKYGLKLFAEQVSNAGSLTANPAAGFEINAATVQDLKQEFYQTLLKYIETTSYKDILLMPKVQVTPNTAKLYNFDSARSPGKGVACTNTAANTWAECDLSPKRGNFFGTVSFLNSASSSFLETNNNYRRGGNIFGVIAGQLLMAQTNGPKGVKPDPVPDCITTKDGRMVAENPKNLNSNKAPRGATAVPKSGAICQGCHLYKGLHLASYVFRPFDQYGLMFPATTAFNTNNMANPYRAAVQMASAEGVVNGQDADAAVTQVTAATLSQLYGENDTLEPQCLNDRSGKKLADVSNVGDLTKHLIGDGKILVNGLSRYLPSVLFNMGTTNQEIVAAVASAYTKGEGKLLPVFEAFFNTQTFACATASEN
ncbi:MAG: hypothetical protein FJ146_06305 [Deltaproteobacteria bacterium]|nr:hypothetical protein [Deltaproteobacteria bacterium]